MLRIIIDGYNFLKTFYNTSDLSEKKRTQFLRVMASYGHRKNMQIIMVFDGGSSSWPTQTSVGKYVTSVETGFNADADTYIISWLEEHTQRPVLMISSDRVLTKKAKELGATTMKSDQFWGFVLESMLPPQSEKEKKDVAHKTTEQSSSEVDLLMKGVKKVPMKEEQKDNRCESQPPVSKKKRGYQKIVKRL